jgi:DNA-binding beta-propeller fold protein YncE
MRPRCRRACYRISVIVLLGVTAMLAAQAQQNPYREVPGWIGPPESRAMGAVSSIYTDASGNVWIAERCGENSCVDRDAYASVHLYDASGRWIRGIGAGRLVWPHGIYVDATNNVWVTDARGEGPRGHQVIKFSADGAVVMTLGDAGRPGNGPGQLDSPTGVVVAPDGAIFVTDGHEPESNNRVLKFSPEGQFLTSWGGTGTGPGQFRVPHAIAIDSQGRVIVADRDNARLQVFDQEGEFLAEWPQFGRATGLYIAADDAMVVSDNQSNAARNPGWPRGIYLGSARDGSIAAFIADADFDPGVAAATGAHGVAANAAGEIFGAEVGTRTVRKYVRR